jgi:hypothetical protein
MQYLRQLLCGVLPQRRRFNEVPRTALAEPLSERTFAMRKRWILLTVTVIAVAGASIAYASIPDPSGVIHGCRNNASGLLRVIDSATSSCNPSETALNWVQPRADEIFRVDPVEITGTSRATGNLIMTLHLPPGAYAATTEVEASGTGDWVIKCSTLSRNNRGGPSEGEVRGAVGTGPGDSRLATLTGVTAFDLPNGDDVTLSCWKQGAGSGANPVAEVADITAVRVQSVSSTGV